MKGKIAFVLGAAVGYVLGTRAGRERYEQIKRGAQAVWNTPTVQRGVQSAQDAVGERVDELKSTALRAGKDAFTAFARGSSSGSQTDSAGASKPSASKSPASKSTASKLTSTKSSGSKSSGAKSSGSKSSSTKQGGSRSGAKPKGGAA